MPARNAMDFDVVIVGAGPAGLAAAIRLKQLAADLDVVIVEKGSEVGAHILSAAVIDPAGLDRLLPGWRTDVTCPIQQPVAEDRFYWLGENMAVHIPSFLLPPPMSNKGNFIVSVGNFCRWLGKKAEGLGVEIYSGFAVAEVLYGPGGEVFGVATGDMGIDKTGNPKEGSRRGIELRAKYTLIADGACGSLSKAISSRFALHQGRDPQKFGIGLEELWQVQADMHRAGLIQHSFEWPLGNATGGGSFLYHFEQNLVAVGSVVHPDDHNPSDELQRFKSHPLVRGTFDGATRLACGARATTAGGWQSVPKLVFPGGALIGCAAGFMNVARIKGTHNAIWSAILAAEHTATALAAARAHDELTSYEMGWRGSAIGRDLRPVRNFKPLWSKLGMVVGIALGGFDIWTNMLGFSLFGTLHHGKSDPLCRQRSDLLQNVRHQRSQRQHHLDAS
ncbi:MAG TPA: NAD(P)/FAD-dependent oxidoreductase [Steroidobacteraceae bacterium]|nr:NAD(P)/FAD-dependent oxidoreductase [Steroidobacteraceae bacterium]